MHCCKEFQVYFFFIMKIRVRLKKKVVENDVTTWCDNDDEILFHFHCFIFFSFYSFFFFWSDKSTWMKLIIYSQHLYVIFVVIVFVRLQLNLDIFFIIFPKKKLQNFHLSQSVSYIWWDHMTTTWDELRIIWRKMRWLNFLYDDSLVKRVVRGDIEISK